MTVQVSGVLGLGLGTMAKMYHDFLVIFNIKTKLISHLKQTIYPNDLGDPLTEADFCF